MILWIAMGLPILILFAAFSIDMGMIYQSRARLSNAVDSAVLTGAKNYSQGVTTAQALATDMFVANYGSSSPALTWTWCPADVSCTGTDLSVTLRAVAKVNTTFMAYLPRWAQWSIADVGQATRSNLVMSLVLDRSGSMACTGGTTDCGGVALQAAVPIFIDNFVNGTDHLAMITFAGNSRVDVPMTTNFTTAMTTAVSGLQWNGGTFGTGAGSNSYDTAHGPPMSLADNQNASVVLAAGQPETKVVVYFTDGLMNIVQDTLTCQNTLGKTLYNYGGYDSPSTTFDFFDPTSDYYPVDDYSYYYGGSTNGGKDDGTGAGCPKTTGKQGYCNANPPHDSTYSCKGVTGFPSQQSGTTVPFSTTAITAEAQYRAIQTATAMRTESPVPTYIYVIGLGSQITVPSTQKFLATLANDPQGIYGNPYFSTQTSGYFYPVTDCPSSTCTQSLTNAFEDIARRVLLRLTQ